MQEADLKKSHVSCCKNHPEILSRYFVTEQPWIKYCKECALNVALCGRNISQDFSTDQFQRKMQIASVVSEFKRTTQQSQENNNQYEKLMAILEDCSKPLTERIHDIDKAIRELIEVRDKLQQLYDKEIVGGINDLLERQSRMALHCRQVKSQLQLIQSHFSTLIEQYKKSEFDEKLQQWEEMNKTVKKELIREDEFNSNKDRLLEVMEVFYNEIQKLSNFTLDLPVDSRQTTTPEDTFSMVLTPVDCNSLAMSIASDNNVFKKSKRQLKLRSNKKNQTQRETFSNTKPTKKASICIPDPNGANLVRLAR